MTVSIEHYKKTYVIVENEDIPLKEWNQFIQWITSDELDEAGTFFELGSKKIGIFVLGSSDGRSYNLIAGFELTGYDPEEGDFYIDKDMLTAFTSDEAYEEFSLPPIIKRLAKRF